MVFKINYKMKALARGRGVPAGGRLPPHRHRLLAGRRLLRRGRQPQRLGALRDGRCSNGTACNPLGNICGAKVLPDGGSVNAPQDRCDGQKDVCKLDAAGIPRCFGGGGVPGCATGYTGQAPCCIAAGAGCQFSEQCCDGQRCLPGDGGVLRCGATEACTALGAACASSGSCCPGSECLGGACRPPAPDAGSSADGGFNEGGGSCVANDGGCTGSAQCCSLRCVSGTCAPGAACQPAGGACTSSSDCCSGEACLPSSTGATCGAASCVGPGQACATGGTACCLGLSCVTPTWATCGAAGDCSCQAQLN